jgi:hypothetical protein
MQICFPSRYIAFSNTEINKKDLMREFIESYAEIVGFDIFVEKLPIVNIFDVSDRLVDEHKHCF